MRYSMFYRERPKEIIRKEKIYKDYICKLGKIEFIELRHLYDMDYMLGISIGFDIGDGGAVCTDIYINMSSEANWSCDTERMQSYWNFLQTIQDMLLDAKKESFDKLKGIPVEMFFNGNGGLGDEIIGFRILKEVL